MCRKVKLKLSFCVFCVLIETVFAFQLTAYGEPCLDECKQRGFPYSWCHKLSSRNGTWIDRDYCSPRPGVTRYLEPCLEPCQRKGSFYYCQTQSTVRGDWDYCSPFPQDRCSWSSWDSWSDCSSTCGSGSTKTRRRRMESSNGSGRVLECSGEIEVSIRSCETKECPQLLAQNCEWSSWNSWSSCSVLCGGEGFRIRERSLLSEASSGELPCNILDNKESSSCGSEPCSIESSSDDETSGFLGDFITKFHGVSGQVYYRDETTLEIKHFTYDGTGPDAFFTVGTFGLIPREENATILSYPFLGKFYDYNDSQLISLGRIDDENIILQLPPVLRVSQLKWISVWCRRFSIDFGHSLLNHTSISYNQKENRNQSRSQPRSYSGFESKTLQNSLKKNKLVSNMDHFSKVVTSSPSQRNSFESTTQTEANEINEYETTTIEDSLVFTTPFERKESTTYFLSTKNEINSSFLPFEKTKFPFLNSKTSFPESFSVSPTIKSRLIYTNVSRRPPLLSFLNSIKDTQLSFSGNKSLHLKDELLTSVPLKETALEESSLLTNQLKIQTSDSTSKSTRISYDVSSRSNFEKFEFTTLLPSLKSFKNSSSFSSSSSFVSDAKERIVFSKNIDSNSRSSTEVNKSQLSSEFLHSTFDENESLDLELTTTPTPTMPSKVSLLFSKESSPDDREKVESTANPLQNSLNLRDIPNSRKASSNNSIFSESISDFQSSFLDSKFTNLSSLELSDVSLSSESLNEKYLVEIANFSSKGNSYSSNDEFKRAIIVNNSSFLPHESNSFIVSLKNTEESLSDTNFEPTIPPLSTFILASNSVETSPSSPSPSSSISSSSSSLPSPLPSSSPSSLSSPLPSSPSLSSPLPSSLSSSSSSPSPLAPSSSSPLPSSLSSSSSFSSSSSLPFSSSSSSPSPSSPSPSSPSPSSPSPSSPSPSSPSLSSPSPSSPSLSSSFPSPSSPSPSSSLFPSPSSKFIKFGNKPTLNPEGFTGTIGPILRKTFGKTSLFLRKNETKAFKELPEKTQILRLSSTATTTISTTTSFSTATATFNKDREQALTSALSSQNLLQLLSRSTTSTSRSTWSPRRNFLRKNLTSTTNEAFSLDIRTTPESLTTEAVHPTSSISSLSRLKSKSNFRSLFNAKKDFKKFDQSTRNETRQYNSGVTKTISSASSLVFEPTTISSFSSIKNNENDDVNLHKDVKKALRNRIKNEIKLSLSPKVEPTPVSLIPETLRYSDQEHLEIMTKFMKNSSEIPEPTSTTEVVKNQLSHGMYDPCNAQETCGPNAICTPISNEALCSCPQGFSGIPRDGIPDPSHGCVRTPNNCINHECEKTENCVSNQCLPKCQEDSTCSLGERCVSNSCIKICFYDAHCLAGEFCQKMNDSISNGICWSGCKRDTNCPFGQICEDADGKEHKCVDGCHFNNDCTAQNSCIQKQCQDPCAHFDECGTNAICEVISHAPTCKCPENFRELNSPYVACVPANMDLADISCFKDADCSNGQLCSHWKCV